MIREARKVKPAGIYVAEDLARATLVRREGQIDKMKERGHSEIRDPQGRQMLTDDVASAPRDRRKHLTEVFNFSFFDHGFCYFFREPSFPLEKGFEPSKSFKSIFYCFFKEIINIFSAI